MISSLDDQNYIAGIDKSKMLDTVEAAPNHIIMAQKIPVSLQAEKEFSQIIIAGMGGSAIAGDVVSDLFFDSIKTPIYVSRGYVLPASFNEKSIFIAISYSGETEETLSALKEAESRKMEIICMSSGGKLKEIAMAKKYALVELMPGFQPRAAFYMIFTCLIRVLEAFSAIPSQKKNLEETIQVLEELKGEIGPQKAERSNPAKLLAKKIKGKIPLIFSSVSHTYACGVRLKTQFNENSKIPGFVSALPELNHNEIVGYANLKKGKHDYSAILLRTDDEHWRIIKRIEITKSLIGNNLGGIQEINAKGTSRLAKILSLIYFGDFVSCYLAIIQGIDPTPVDVITKLKKELKR